MSMFQAENLRHIRDQRDIPRKEVCAALGVDEQLYIAWENGDAVPDKAQQEALADFFGVSVNSLHHQIEVFGSTASRISEEEKQRWQDEKRVRDDIYCRNVKRMLVVMTVMESLSVLASLLNDPLTSLVGAGLTVFFLVKLWCGKNWARVLFAVFTALSFVGYLFSDVFETVIAGGFASLDVMSVILLVFSLIMLVYNGFLFWFLTFSESMKAYIRICNE